MKYGTIYSLVDFCDRLVPKKGEVDRELLKETFDGLRRLAILQDSNPWITLHATLSAGLWVNYKGYRYCLINPAKNFLRVGAAYKHVEAAARIEAHLGKMIELGEVEEVENIELKQWRLYPTVLPKLWSFFEKLERPKPADLEDLVGKHPRFFSSEDRVTALDEFEKTGRFCPGVGKKIPRHKVGPNESIEYDHIIPHARGGASTLWNLSILCVECNRTKAATAA
jgi:hypothetical protein